jgi:hypothetical protein
MFSCFRVYSSSPPTLLKVKNICFVFCHKDDAATIVVDAEFPLLKASTPAVLADGCSGAALSVSYTKHVIPSLTYDHFLVYFRCQPLILLLLLLLLLLLVENTCIPLMGQVFSTWKDWWK